MPLNGIDVSGFQPENITDLVQADFAIVKATGGTGYINPCVQKQLQGGPFNNGLYHFAGDGYPWTTPEAEAEHFLEAWRRYAEPNTIPILDWEPPAPVHDTAWAFRWLDIVAGATGKTPLLYCNLSVATSYDWTRVQNLGVKLWLAWYGSDAQINGYTPPYDLSGDEVGNWRLALYQYTQHGRLPGYAGDLDLNIAYEDVWATDSDLIPGVRGVEA